MKTFRALVVERSAGAVTRSVRERTVAELPAGDVLIAVRYSALNYKDALSASGHPGITRLYPHTPGIDAAGVVVESAVPAWKAGDEVVVTGFDLGMNTSGGFGQAIRVPAGWVVKRPTGLSLKECMGYGTAGLTVALAIEKLMVNGLTKERGPVVVTGATGGVGSFAVAILAKLGFKVTAVTGKQDQKDYLRSIGAVDAIDREEAAGDPKKVLLAPRWAAGVDTVGGNILAGLLKSTMRRGSIVACGLAQSPELHMMVYPFILNGVNLLGVDSAETPLNHKKNLWEKLSKEWKIDVLDRIIQNCRLEDLDAKINAMLEGKIKGRTVVEHDARDTF